jgi:hypothetical protein
MLDDILEIKNEQPAPAPQKTSCLTDPITPKHLFALLDRYKDAYLVARALDGYGTLVKVLGFVGAGMLLLYGASWVNNGRLGDASFAFGVVCIVAGLFMAVLFYFAGVLVSAQGQILNATLDSAVNGSPFLTDEHRARIMSLPSASAL